MQSFKRCSHCKVTKPLSDFGRNSSDRDGLNHNCRSCTSQIGKAAYALHGDLIRQRSRERYASNGDSRRAAERHRYASRRDNGWPERPCPICGALFQKATICCSTKCLNEWKARSQRGEKNPFWKGGRRINAHGYVVLRRYGGKRKDGYVFEHREVMEDYLRRKLSSWEVVHHRNGNKSDNRIENLMIVSHATHAGQIVCPDCGFIFYLH